MRMEVVYPEDSSTANYTSECRNILSESVEMSSASDTEKNCSAIADSASEFW